MHTIEQRLNKLERRLKFFQSATLLLLLGGIFLFITAFDNTNQVTDLIKAKEIRIVDNNGKSMMVLGSDYKGGDMKVYSAEGVNTIHLLQSTAGTGVVATENKSGNLAVRIGDYSTGTGCIEVYNEKGTSVSQVGSTTAGTGFMGTKTEDGYDLVKLTFTSTDHSGWIGIYNSSHQNIVRIAGTDNSNGSLGIYNASGTKVGYVGCTDDGGGCVNIYDKYGNGLNGVWPK